MAVRPLEVLEEIFVRRAFQGIVAVAVAFDLAGAVSDITTAQRWASRHRRPNGMHATKTWRNFARPCEPASAERGSRSCLRRCSDRAILPRQ